MTEKSISDNGEMIVESRKTHITSLYIFLRLPSGESIFIIEPQIKATQTENAISFI